MPKLCPACQRPNGDLATECLYCTEPLPESPEAEPSEQAIATAAQDRAEWHLVIVLPQSGTSDEALSAYANAMNVVLYDARLALAADRPRLARRIDDRELAQDMSAELQSAGIAHYVVPESEVLAQPITSAPSARLHERHLELELEGEAVSIAYPDLLLIVQGDIHRERHHESRMATTRGASYALTPGVRFHIYSRAAPVAIEIDPDEFDWSVLGPSQTSSVHLNVRLLLDAILERSHTLELDRGFRLEPVVLSRSQSAAGLDDALAASTKGPGGVVYDNEPQFRFYARWRYRVARFVRK